MSSLHACGLQKKLQLTDGTIVDHIWCKPVRVSSSLNLSRSTRGWQQMEGVGAGCFVSAFFLKQIQKWGGVCAYVCSEVLLAFSFEVNAVCIANIREIRHTWLSVLLPFQAFVMRKVSIPQQKRQFSIYFNNCFVVFITAVWAQRFSRKFITRSPKEDLCVLILYFLVSRIPWFIICWLQRRILEMDGLPKNDGSRTAFG